MTFTEQSTVFRTAGPSRHITMKRVFLPHATSSIQMIFLIARSGVKMNWVWKSGGTQNPWKGKQVLFCKFASSGVHIPESQKYKPVFSDRKMFVKGLHQQLVRINGKTEEQEEDEASKPVWHCSSIPGKHNARYWGTMLWGSPGSTSQGLPTCQRYAETQSTRYVCTNVISKIGKILQFMPKSLSPLDYKQYIADLKS